MGPIAKRAALEAAKLVKLDTVENAVFLIAGQIILAVVLWFAQDDAGLWVRIGSAALPFLLYPAALAWKLVIVPGIMLGEVTAENEALRAAAAVDPLAHQLAITAEIESTWPDEPSHALARVHFKASSTTPIQLHRMTATITLNDGPPLARAGSPVIVRRGQPTGFTYDLGSIADIAEKGVAVFDVRAPFGPVNKPPTRVATKTLRVAYVKHGGIPICHVTTTAEAEEAI